MTNNDEQLNNDEVIEEHIDAEPELEEKAVDEIVNDEAVNDEAVNENAVDGQVAEPVISQKRKKAELVLNIALWIAIVVLVAAVFLRVFVYSTVEVEGASMTPTYNNNNDKNETVLVNKMATPKRGDVVVFYKNEVDNKFMAQFASREECAEGQPYEKLIKRVVALEGDKIWARCVSNDGNDVVYEIVIDTAGGDRLVEDYYVKKGEKLDNERYYIHSVGITDLGLLHDCTEDNPYVVKEDCFFAMGDNRSNSMDSRKFGEVKLTQIFGVVLDK